jgi:hypothetical protein
MCGKEARLGQEEQEVAEDTQEDEGISRSRKSRKTRSTGF